MKKFCTLFTLLAMSLGTMAQSQYFYEWKGGVITVRTISEIDSLSYPIPSDVANFTTDSPMSLTGSEMTASYSVHVSGILPDVNACEMGVCYSSSNPVPSIDNYTAKYGTYKEGTWNVTLTELTSSTTYYYSPYVKIGDIAYYGPVKSFTTLANSTNTLWDLLESRKDLSNFCELVGRTPYFYSHSHRAYTLDGNDTIYYTFKDVLKANNHMTIWAPINSAFTEEEWAEFRHMAETDAYNLQLQLIGNHLALFSKVMCNSGQEEISLINGKNVTINYEESKLQNIKVIEKNIPARNGVMHIIDEGNDFVPNLYEYIRYSGEAGVLGDYVAKRDEVYFAEQRGYECVLDEEGYPIYDSNVIQSNRMFTSIIENPTDLDATDAWMNPLKMFGAAINDEDAAYVMIVPTDAAWENATEMLMPYYNYVSTYPRMDKVNLSSTKGVFSSIYGARHSYTTEKGYETVDSLQKVNIDMDIVSPLVFNIEQQPTINGTKWTAEDFVNGGYQNCEYLLTTAGDTLRDIYEDNVLVWSKNSLFENSNTKKMSNGYAIVSEKWNYPRQYWMRDLDVDASFNNMYEKSTATRLTDRDMNNTLAASWIDEYGRVSEQRYLSVAGQAPSVNPEVAFGLKGSKQGEAHVMSGKYDVQIVLVPRWYETSEAERDTTAAIQKNRLVCTLYYWDETLAAKADPKDNPGARLDLKYTKQIKLESDKIEYSGEKVDTITVLTDVEFPVSYKNLIEAYPVLNIKCDKLSNTEIKNGYSRAFNIDRIILKSKEE